MKGKFVIDINKCKELKNKRDAFLSGALTSHLEKQFICDVIDLNYELQEMNNEQISKYLQPFIDSILNSERYKKCFSDIEEKRVNNIRKQYERHLYYELIKYCKDFYDNYECKCEKYPGINNNTLLWNRPLAYNKEECEIYCSKVSQQYYCEIMPYTYFYYRADRHTSELMYALNTLNKTLKNLPEYNIVEFGCGPAMSLVAIDYYNKINENNKHVNYIGIDCNNIWTPIHNKIKEYIDICKYPYSFNFYEGDILDENYIKEIFDNNILSNIICINYVVSWFAQNKEYNKIEKLFQNIISIINKKETTVIIINDPQKGADEFIRIKEIFNNCDIKYKIVNNDLSGEPTIMKKSPYGENNKCSSNQIIIIIGGEDDN